MNYQNFQELLAGYMMVIMFFIVWEIVWKMIAMWKAARNNQLGWFICIALINTAGILPIIYILLNKDKSSVTNVV